MCGILLPIFFFFLVKCDCVTPLQSCRRTEYASSTLSYFTHTHIRLTPVGLDHIFNPLQVCVRSHREAHGVKPLLMPDWIYQKHQHLLFQPSQLAFLLLFIPLFSSCHPPAVTEKRLWHLQRPDLWGKTKQHGFPSHHC